MDGLNLFGTLLFCFILGVCFLLWIFRNNIENSLKKLVASSIDFPTIVQVNPRASIKKQWMVQEEILGTLEINASGMNLKESLAGVERLLSLTVKHDKSLEGSTKQKEKDVCIG